jgi:hypothetical protein
MNVPSRYEQTLLTQLIAQQEKRRRANDSRPQLPLYDTVLPAPKEPVPSVYDAEGLLSWAASSK